jgi:hypothetical protein
MSRRKGQTTIAISRKNREALRTYGKAGDTSNDILTILLNMIDKDRGNIVSTRQLTGKNAQFGLVKRVGQSL